MPLFIYTELQIIISDVFRFSIYVETFIQISVAQFDFLIYKKKTTLINLQHLQKAQSVYNQNRSKLKYDNNQRNYIRNLEYMTF